MNIVLVLDFTLRSQYLGIFSQSAQKIKFKYYVYLKWMRSQLYYLMINIFYVGMVYTKRLDLLFK